MAKDVFLRLRFYIRYLLSLLQISVIRVYDVLSSAFSVIKDIRERASRFLKTSKNHYTVLIVPQKKSSVRKISASSSAIRMVMITALIVSISILYVFYEYLSVKRNDFELDHLRKLSAAQREQIQQISSKIGYFEKKLESLKEYDQQIRSMADMVVKDRQDKKAYRGVGGPSAGHDAALLPGQDSAAMGRIDRSMDRLIRDASQQERSYREIVEFLEKRKSILARTPSVWPVEGWVTSEFGMRHSPFSGRREFHGAIDIAARSGRPVVAPADGIVSDVEHRSDLGNNLSIDHGNGIETSYAHLLRCSVQKGQSIRRGDVIGYIGSTGRSTGPHLHYVVQINGVPVNPRNYLPR